jgi:hypothetical protein
VGLRDVRPLDLPHLKVAQTDVSIWKVERWCR